MKPTDKNAPLREHQFDGTQEYDNAMPTWWVWTFLLSIIFSYIYFIHYSTGAGPNQKMEFETAMEQHQKKYASSLNALATLSESEVLERIKKINDPDLGAKVYVKYCQSCHAENLEGLVGPHLADEYWIHGEGKLHQIVGLIANGVIEKGMPAWGQMLKEEETLAVTSYIHSKRGSRTQGGRPPQGQAYPEYLKQ